MASVTDVTVLTTTTNILTSAESSTIGSPIYIKNESSEVVPLILGSSDPYDLDPGEVWPVLPGQAVTGTSASGTAVVQVIVGVKPADESSSSGGGAVGASGSVAATSGAGVWSAGQNDFTAVYASTTTLTLGTFPTAMGTVRDEQFFLVVVTDADGLQRTYTPTANAMTLSGQALTVAGGSFDPTDLGYDVMLWGPPKNRDATINGEQVRVLNPPTVDSVTGAVLGISYDHHEIHEGNSYHVSDVQAVDDTIQYWVVTAPDSLAWGHMVFGVEGTGEIAVTITEGGDRTPSTALTAINRNRNSSNTATVTVHRGYTAGTTDGAVTIWGSRSGSTSQGGNLSLAGVGRGRLEYELKQDTQYIIAVETFAAIHVSIELDWYEHEDVGA